jgi:hypothetical protein
MFFQACGVPSLAPGTASSFKSDIMLFVRGEMPDKDDSEIPGENEIDFVPTLRNFLLPYEPAAGIKEADKFFTTNEILARLEMHLGMIRRSDPFGIENGINGVQVVTEISALGFKAANVGGCMQWLMKKKSS